MIATSLTFRHTVKTAVATTLSALIYVLFEIPAGYWMAVSAVVVMHSGIDTGSMESSLRASRDRIFGTLVGSIVGIGGALLTTIDIWWVVPGLALAVFICSYLAAFFPPLRIASLTAVLIMLIGAYEPEAWHVAFERAGGIIAGCLIAAAVNLLLWPYRAKDHLRSGLGDVCALFTDYYRQITSGRDTAEVRDQIEAAVFKNSKTARDLGTALGISRDRFEAYYTALQLEEEIHDELKVIERSAKGARHLIEREDFSGQVGQVAQLMIEVLGALPSLFAKQGERAAHLLEESLDRLHQKIEHFREEQRTLDKALPFHEVADLFSFLYGTRRLASMTGELEEVAVRLD